MPSGFATCIRASLAVAGGQPEYAERLTSAVLSVPDLNLRMQLLATAIRIAALSSDPARAKEVDVLVATEEWERSLGSVALAPDAAKERIAAALQVRDLHELVGLQPSGSGAGSAPAVDLTARQVEVLMALDSDRTMPEIAASMYVSPETIRSIAKEIYRRLGVHDRAAAVETARILGLIGL